MTNQQKVHLFDTLMRRPMIECKGDNFGLQLYIDSTTEDLRVLEPEIDVMLESAQIRGWLQATLEQAARRIEIGAARL
jgi:hypothetical protein